MSLHINASIGDIAPVVLLAGDPLRAKNFAERYLEGYRQVASTRNMFYFTGKYNGADVTIGGSGMGCPSIGIYAYELYSYYQAQSIIRIGTAGAYTDSLSVYDLINVSAAFSESTFAREAFGYDEEGQEAQGRCFSELQQAAYALNRSLHSAHIHSSDVFYRSEKGTPPMAIRNQCPAVEMEAFALFATARYLNREAGTLLTISDVIPTGVEISPEEREKALQPMVEVALLASTKLHP
jgi:purine-nucleoside phosphorylase